MSEWCGEHSGRFMAASFGTPLSVGRPLSFPYPEQFCPTGRTSSLGRLSTVFERHWARVANLALRLTFHAICVH